MWRIKKSLYFHKIFVHILPKRLIFKLGNADLGFKTNIVQSENNKEFLLWMKYILSRSGYMIPKLSKMEFVLKLVGSFTKSSILNPVSVLDVSLLWTMKIQNNLITQCFCNYRHTCSILYTIHPLNNNHNFWCIHNTHMLCNNHVTCFTNIYLETEQN